MSTKERAAFFFLEGIAQNSMLQELRCLQMHGMIQGLSLVEEWPSFTPALVGGRGEGPLAFARCWPGVFVDQAPGCAYAVCVPEPQQCGQPGH